MSDNVEHPSHYKAGGVETIEGIRAALGDGFLDYCRGNVLKYVWRCRHKGNTLEDLRKAAKYLEWAIAEAGSEKPSGPQELAIPEGWRELEENEPLSEDDLFELDGEWVGHEYDPSGGAYSSRIYCRHIRKIETEKPEHIEGVWVEEAEEKPVFTLDEIEELIDKQIAEQERIKNEKEEADANASRKIETENPSEIPNSSIPDPGEGYRLLSKDPPEDLQPGDDFWSSLRMKWWPSSADCGSVVQSKVDYYRRKIEPTEWIPKVGDKVRVNRHGRLSDGKIGVIVEGDAGEYTVRISGHNLTSRNLTADDLELVEAAQ